MRLFNSPEAPSSLELKVSFLPLPFTSTSFFEFLPSILYFKMGYAFLLNTAASLATFRQKFDIPDDVEVVYCHESKIILHRWEHIAFFPLMAILEGGVRFPMDTHLLNTLRYYGLCPNQLPPNFYRVVSCFSRLNHVGNMHIHNGKLNGSTSFINRLSFSLPHDKSTLWEIEDWSLNHLGHFSKVCNFYGKSLIWGYPHWGLVPFLDSLLLRS